MHTILLVTCCHKDRPRSRLLKKEKNDFGDDWSIRMFFVAQEQRKTTKTKKITMFIFSTCLQKSSFLWTVSTSQGQKCTSDVRLITCRRHAALLSYMGVCRGTGPRGQSSRRPPSLPAPSCLSLHKDCSHTYLPVKSFIPLHHWSMTVSTCGIRCFLHRCYTDYIWINVLVAFFSDVFWCQSS